MSKPTTRPITRDDLEAKFRELEGSRRAGADAAKGTGKLVGIAAALGGMGLAYLLGRRRGKKRRTVVEVRRV